MNGGKVIMVKNKQPVVYVARRIFDKSGRFYCVGYFVSKAYLLHKETTYKKNGIANTNYTVDIGPERYEETWNGELRHMDQLLPRDVMDENYCIIYDSAETCHRVFSNYQDCYKYTGKENKRLHAERLKEFSKGSQKYNEAKAIYDGALEFAENIERKYISEAGEIRDRLAEDEIGLMDAEEATR